MNTPLDMTLEDPARTAAPTYPEDWEREAREADHRAHAADDWHASGGWDEW